MRSKTLDYWTLDIDQRVDTMSTEMIQIQQIILWEKEGLGADISSKLPGVSITYRGGNNIDEIVAPKANQGHRETAGIDWTVNGNIETEMGDISLDMNWTHMIKFKTSFVDADGTIVLGQDELGQFDRSNSFYRPENRVTVQIGWSLDDHSVSLASTYLAGMENTERNETDTADIVVDTLDSYLSHNLSYNYHTPWNSKLSIGILNLTDKTPPRAKNENPRDPINSLYDIRGRVFTVGFTQTF